MNDTLKAYFGDAEEESAPEPAMRPQDASDGAGRRTCFPHVEEDVRVALDEFLAATRGRMGDPDYLPDAAIRTRWIGQARRLIRGHGGYRAGFYEWAIARHAKQFKEKGLAVIVTGPATIDYLWETYRDRAKVLEGLGVFQCPTCCTYHGKGECPEEAE